MVDDNGVNDGGRLICQTLDDLRRGLEQAELVRHLSIRALDDDPLIDEIRHCSNVELLILNEATLERASRQLSDVPALADIVIRGDFTHFPEALGRFGQVVELRIEGRNLTEISSAIGGMRSLQKLTCVQNRLEHIAPAVCSLPLLYLSLVHNRILALPNEIGQLDQLRALHLDYNQLASLPDSIGDLNQLEDLSLPWNLLTTLPASLGRLRQLRELDVRGNRFETLPSELAPLADSLETFRIKREHRQMIMDWSYPVGDTPQIIDPADFRLFLDDQDRRRDDVRETLAGYGAESALPQVRRSIAVVATDPADYSTVGVSRAGGFPDLADPDQFPTTSGEYWMFLAQINLADIAGLNSFLPRSGLLSFFAESQESSVARILYTPEPFDNLAPARIDPGQMYRPEDDTSESPHRLGFEPVTDVELYERQRDDDYEEAMHAVAFRGDHAINAYTFAQGESPQEMAAAEMRGTADEWIPLLKLGFDSKVGFSFGDAGTITFSIHQEALSRHDFSNVHFHLYT